MSKSLNSIFLPAAGVTALVLAGAVGLALRDYKQTELDMLETQLEQANARADGLVADVAAQGAADGTWLPRAFGCSRLGRQHVGQMAAPH